MDADVVVIGGFESDPLPVDPRHQPPSFTTDDVPLDLGVLRQLAAQITAEVPGLWQYAHYYDPVTTTSQATTPTGR